MSGTTHNVFGIQTGVAISFLVRKAKHKGCRIYYARRLELETAEEKLAFLNQGKLAEVSFEEISPDKQRNWLNLTENDFESLMPIANKSTKLAKEQSKEKAIFRSFSFGVVTNRDDWVYADAVADVANRVRLLIETYSTDLARLGSSGRRRDVGSHVDTSIKWTRAVKQDLERGVKYEFSRDRIVPATYRPFVRRFLYFSPQLNEMPNLMPRYFGADGRRRARALVFTDPTSQKPFMSIAVDCCPDMHLVGAAAGSVVLPLSVDDTGTAIDNVTDWALDQFRKQYQPGRGKKDRPITKEAIFHYVYAVLHDPVYREKYAINLKREFPRIPFYPDFWLWADWGRTLIDLHIGYESVPTFPVKRVDNLDDKARKAGLAPKAILKADKAAGRIIVDSETTLSGVPTAAWDYILGNRSALEWVLDQYKEKRPKDPTIREKFNTYRFADYKERVVDLLMRVTTVSVETTQIVNEMRAARRQD